MATRLFMYGTNTPAVQPPASPLWAASNTNTANAYRDMNVLQGNSTSIQTVTYSFAMVQNNNYKIQSWVSKPIEAQTIPAGTVKGYQKVNENNAVSDMISQLVVKVVSNDGTVLRGYIYGGDTGTTLTSEWPTTDQNRAFPRAALVPAPTTEVVAEEGDRIVVEWGVKKLGATTATYSAALKSSDLGAPKPENETDTGTGAAWVEFSSDIVFFAAATATAEVSWTTYQSITTDYQEVEYSGITGLLQNIRSVAWTSDNQYVAGTAEFTPNLIWFKKIDDRTFERLPAPSGAPTSLAYDSDWSPDGTILAIGANASPYIYLYQRTGDTLTRLPNPATLPTGAGNAVGWSSDGAYLAVGHPNSPFITIYSVSGTTFTKIANPSVLPPSLVTDISWYSNTHLAYAASVSPVLRIYSVSGGVFTTNNVDLAPGTGGKSIDFSRDGNYLAVEHGTSASSYMSVYKRSGNTFTKMNDLVPQVAIHHSALRFNADNDVLYATQQNIEPDEPGIRSLLFDSNNFRREIPQIIGLQSVPRSFDIEDSPDGRHTAVGTSTGISIFTRGNPLSWSAEVYEKVDITAEVAWEVKPPPVELYNTFESGLAAGTVITIANSDDGSAGNAFTAVTGSGMTFGTTSSHGIRGMTVTMSASQSREVGWSFSARNEVYARTYWRRPNSANTAISTAITLNFGYNIGVGFGASGSPMTISFSGNPRVALATGTYAHTDNVWYRIEAYFKAGTGTSGRIEARLYVGDSDTPVDTIGIDAAVPVATGIGFGLNTGQINVTRTDYLDSVAISDAGWIGPYVSPPFEWENTFETGLATGTQITTANSDDGTAGQAFNAIATQIPTYTSLVKRDNLGMSVALTSTQNGVAWTFEGQNIIYGRMYFNRPTRSSGIIAALMQTNGPITGFFVGSTNTPGPLYVGPYARTGLSVGTYTIPDNTWMRLEAKFDAGAGRIEARLYEGDSLTPVDTVVYNGAVTSMTAMYYGLFYSASLTRTEYFDDLGVGNINWLGPTYVPAQVSAEFAIEWNVLTPVSTSSTVNWDISGTVVATFAVTWEMPTPVTATAEITWGTFTTVTITSADGGFPIVINPYRGQEWEVKAPQLVVTFPISWNVVGSASITAPIAWDVTAGALIEVPISWNIDAPVTAVFAVTWDVKAEAPEALFPITWQTRETIVFTAPVDWDVFSVATTEQDVTWLVYKEVTTTRSVTWLVRLGMSVTSQVTWDSYISAVIELETEWNVIGQLAITAEVTWNTIEEIEALYGVTWRFIKFKVPTNTTIKIPPSSATTHITGTDNISTTRIAGNKVDVRLP